MSRGRPPLGARHVDGLDGSEGAKKRLKTVLETFTGQKTVQDACRKLGLQRAAFFRLRERVLQEMLQSLEPRRPGRPKKEPPPEPSEVETLRAKVKELTRDLRASLVREQLARAMPHVLREGATGMEGSKKKPPRAERRRRKKREEKGGPEGRGDTG
jgi:transposase-like protein